MSFYELDSTALGSGERMRAAYLFHYASESGNDERLVAAAVSIAAEMRFDVFNCLHLHRAAAFVRRLGFIEGDGSLRYYLYNWRTAPFEASQVSVVML